MNIFISVMQKSKSVDGMDVQQLQQKDDMKCCPVDKTKKFDTLDEQKRVKNMGVIYIQIHAAKTS